MEVQDFYTTAFLHELLVYANASEDMINNTSKKYSLQTIFIEDSGNN